MGLLIIAIQRMWGSRLSATPFFLLRTSRSSLTPVRFFCSNPSSSSHPEPGTRGYEDKFFKHFKYLTQKSIPDPDPDKSLTGIYKEHISNLEFASKEVRRRLKEFSDTPSSTPLFSIEGRDYRVGEHILMDEEWVGKWVPEGYPGLITKYDHAWNTDRHLLGRECVKNVIEQLQYQQNSGFLTSKGCKPMILDGFNGTGKSITLLHTLLWARASGWLVLFVPYPDQLIVEGIVTQSETVEDVYDLHGAAQIIMQQFKEAHSDKLDKIKMKTSLPPLAAFENFEQKPSTTLLDLIEFGLESENPSEVFLTLRRELDQVTEYPVLLVVDNINKTFGNTGFFKAKDFFKPRMTPVEGGEISLLRCLHRPEEVQMVNGTALYGICGSATQKYFKQAVGAEIIENYKVTIPEYSLEEYYKRVEHYVDTGYIAEELPTQTLDYIYRLCDGRPKHVASYYRIV